jgi:hypothetical protein
MSLQLWYIVSGGLAHESLKRLKPTCHGRGWVSSLQLVGEGSLVLSNGDPCACSSVTFSIELYTRVLVERLWRSQIMRRPGQHGNIKEKSEEDSGDRQGNWSRFTGEICRL